MNQDLIKYLTIPVTPVLQELGATQHNGKTYIKGVGEIAVYTCSVVQDPSLGPLRGMGGVDLLALRELKNSTGVSSDEAYARAIRWVRVNVLHDHSEPAFREIENLGRLARLHRRLYDLLNDAYTADKPFTLHRSSLERSLITNGVDTTHAHAGFCTLSKDGVLLVRKLLDALEVKGCGPSDAAITLPYYVHPHLLGGLRFYSTGLEDYSEIPMVPCRLLYTQLSTISTGTPIILPTPMLSSRLSNLKSAFKGSLSVATSGIGIVDPWVPSGEVSLVYEDHNLPEQVLVSRRLAELGCNSMLLAYRDSMSESETGRRVSTDQLVVDRVVELSHKDVGLTEEIQGILEAAGPSPELKASVASKLRTMGRLKTLHELNQRFSDGLLTKTDKNEVIISPSGYVLHDLRDAEKTQLTNHTMRLNRQVLFPDSAERYIDVTLTVQEKPINTLVPETAFENGKKLNSFFMTSVSDSDEPPRIIDCDKYKYALNYFKTKIPSLKPVAGLSYLGWDGQGARYYTPDYQVSDEGLITGTIPVRPGSTELESFSANLVEPYMDANLPKELCNLVSICLALINRSHASYSIKAVPIYNNANNRLVVSELFKGLGQSASVSYNRNARASAPSVLHGYPHYTVGLSDAQLKHVNQPMVALTDSGMTLPEFTPEQLQAASSTLSALSRLLVVNLCAGNVWVKEPVSRIEYTASLIDEGAELARQAGGLLKWPQAENRYPVLEAALNSIAKDKINEYLLFHFQEQRLHFLTNKLPKSVIARSDELVTELHQLAKKVQPLKGAIAMAADADTQKLFQDFFGVPFQYGTIMSAAVEDLLSSTG
jgi:hypothetical protein